MPETTLLDDLAALVDTHGADEIKLHLDPHFGIWECVWGSDGEREGWASDADLPTAVRAMRTRADELQRSLNELRARQAADGAGKPVIVVTPEGAPDAP